MAVLPKGDPRGVVSHTLYPEIPPKWDMLARKQKTGGLAVSAVVALLMWRSTAALQTGE